MNHKNLITKTTKSPLLGKVRKGYKTYVGIILGITMFCTLGLTAFAADDPVTVVNNLSTFIFGLIRAVGMIILGFGVVGSGVAEIIITFLVAGIMNLTTCQYKQ